MKKKSIFADMTGRKLIAIVLYFFAFDLMGQCPNCGNHTIDSGESNLNCPQDVPQPPTCTSCASIGTFDPNNGIRQTWDFVGTTTFSTTGLPAGWSFASAPSPSTSGAALANDVFGPRHGLVQPNCSGSCTGTNYFCIGNIANLVSSGSQKLGGNFDGRTNVTQNLSYVVLRGANNPALVSPSFNFSGVESFKIQIWLNVSETSCGQMNSWGSCSGNQARLDFSADGGTTWSLNMLLTTSSSNVDMCNNSTTNTFWVQEGTWSRICVTVFRSASSPGNFYTFANANTAPSGIVVNNAYFTNNFRFRIVYLQSASCNNSTTTNPGRYLAVDYPVVTSGNQVIPCGISFIKMCGFGEDNNDENVGSNTSTSTQIAFGTTRRGVNQAERGVEIFTSQNASFQSVNTSGASLPSNHNLCDSEGGDAICADWLSNNNSYFVVYECLTDFEPTSGSVQVNYYKGASPQSFQLTKVTAAGKTPAIGWRWTGSRFINCSNSADLLPGCSGYYFSTTSLPLQFLRVFYGLSIDGLGRTYAYYGPNSCTHYFNGPFISPRTQLQATVSAPNYIACNGNQVAFIGISNFCQTSSAFTGSSTVSVFGPNNPNLLFETINSNTLGNQPVTTPGEYVIVANAPNSPTQCLDCRQKICLNLTTADLDALNCNPLSIQFENFILLYNPEWVLLQWKFPSNEISHFNIQAGNSPDNLKNIGKITEFNANGNYDFKIFREKYLWYRIEAVLNNGSSVFSTLKESQNSNSFYQVLKYQNRIQISNYLSMNIQAQLMDLNGKIIKKIQSSEELIEIPVENLPKSLYLLELQFIDGSKVVEKIWME